MTQYNLLGVKINIIAEHLLKNTLVDFLNSKKQHQIVTVNPEFIVTAQKNKKFLEILNQASVSLIDGAGIIKALQYLGHDVSLAHRITGVRLNEILIDLAVNKKLKIMFCLYSQGLTSNQKLSDVIEKQYPALNWQIADENNALELGQKFSPDIVLVGFGAPWQNFWIAENIEKIPSTKIAAGVGGTFDFISGTIKRAPKLMQSLGLEWLWRLSLQPGRLSRIVRAVIVFPYLIYKNKGKK